jgi:hypothetical protein
MYICSLKNNLDMALLLHKTLAVHYVSIQSFCRRTRVVLLFIIVLLTACSDDKKPNQSYVAFSEKQITIPASSGELTVMVQWEATAWQIVMDTDNGIISGISQTTGGDKKDQTEYARVKFSYNANTTGDPRTQEVFLVNKTNGERAKLVIEQESIYAPVVATVIKSVKYLPIIGFGGMHSVKIWLAANNLITSAEIDKMYAGYIARNAKEIEIYRRDKNIKIPVGFDYEKLAGLTNELVEKLTRARPENMAALSKIPGMTPAGIMVVLQRLRNTSS